MELHVELGILGIEPDGSILMTVDLSNRVDVEEWSTSDTTLAPDKRGSTDIGGDSVVLVLRSREVSPGPRLHCISACCIHIRRDSPSPAGR